MREKTATQIFPFTPSDTFGALLAAFNRPGPYHITGVDQNNWTIYLNAGVSFRSWGEYITITVYSTPDGLTQVWIRSSSKMALIDWGKNQDNIGDILNRLHFELRSCQPIV